MVCIGPFCLSFWHILLLIGLAFRLVQSYIHRGVKDDTSSNHGALRVSKYVGEAGSELKAKQSKENKVSPYKHDVKSYAEMKKCLEEFQLKFPHLDSTKDRRIVVKFTASWCGPCQRVEPVVEDLRWSCKGAFFSVDVEKTVDDIASGITSMPTFRVLEWKAFSGTDASTFRVLGTHRGAHGVERFLESCCGAFD